MVLEEHIFVTHVSLHFILHDEHALTMSQAALHDGHIYS